MTYFVKPDHSYHRVIFEFTDTEMKDAGFEQLSLQPGALEILRLLRRIEGDMPLLELGLYKDGKAEINDAAYIPPLVENKDEKSKEAYLSEMEETMKRFSRENHADLQRKKDGWKAKALRLIGFLNNKDKKIERLQDKYEKPGQKCGNGHVNNLPIKLWDCPVCTEKLRKEKKWLLNGWAIMRSKVFPRQYPSAYEKENLLVEMQQALQDQS